MVRNARNTLVEQKKESPTVLPKEIPESVSQINIGDKFDLYLFKDIFN